MEITDLKNKILLCIGLLGIIILPSCSKENTGINVNDYKTLGTHPGDLLSSSIYTSLKIQIHYMPGFEPADSAINNLSKFLESHLNKPNGIQIDKSPIAPSGAATLNLDQITSIEKSNRTAFTAGSTLAVHILLVDADYYLPEVVGTSYWNTSICIFGKRMNQNSGGPGQVTRATYYTIIFEHEFGHLMGLVNLGSSMQTNHQDNSNGYHCLNANCLMFYGIENSSVNFNKVPVLDADCIADLVANGGK